MQEVFFSTQMAEPTSNKWLGGPQVLLRGTLNDTNTNVIVIMNACVPPSPSHCGPPLLPVPLSSAAHRTELPALRASPSSSLCWEAVVVMHGTEPEARYCYAML